MYLLLRLLINAVGLITLSLLLPGLEVESFYIAVISAIVLGILNVTIRPLVKLLTLPLSILTLGLFALVINALFFWFVATFIDGFNVNGFWPAFWGAFGMSLLSWLSNQFSKAD